MKQIGTLDAVLQGALAKMGKKLIESFKSTILGIFLRKFWGFEAMLLLCNKIIFAVSNL